MGTLPVQIQQPRAHVLHDGNFKEGHPKMGGRQKGVGNRVGADLRQTIMDAITETGFIEKDEEGNPIATGEGGCKGFIKWLALHEPRTAAAMLVKIIPYYVNLQMPEETMSREEMQAQLQLYGLPMDLLEHLRVDALPPEQLDPGEDPDPYRRKPANDATTTPTSEAAE